MGLLDIFFDKDKKQQRQVQSLKKKLHSMWSQSPDRNYAAEQLRDIGTPEAIDVLLERFKLNAQNTTYDNEEKLYLYELLVALGPSIVEPIQSWVRKEELQVNWALRVLDALLDKDAMADFLTTLLQELDTEYTRDPEKKHQLILRAQKYTDHDPLQEQIARFVMDDNEGIRFISVTHLTTLERPWLQAAFQGNLRFEDSGRILDLVGDYLVQHPEWTALPDPADEKARRDLLERLPPRFLLTPEGHLRAK